MSKQPANSTPASAEGIAGWSGNKGHVQVSAVGLPALSRRGIHARVQALWQQWQQAVAGQGKAVSVDEITRRDADMPSFNFTGTPGALQWWPSDR